MQSDAQRDNTRIVLKELFDLWERRSGLYGDVLFCSAITNEHDGKWRNVTSFLIPMQKGEQRPVDGQADYGNFKLVEGTMALGDAKAALSGVVERDRLRLTGFPEVEISASMHPSNPKYFWDSGARHFPLSFPCYEFKFNIEQDSKGQLPQGSLCHVDLPLFPSGKEAIEEFFGARFGDFTSYSGRFSALAPDYRGRIREVRLGAKSVEVQVTCPAPSCEVDLVGKLYSRNYRSGADSADLNFSEGKASAKISDFPRDLLVVLLSRKDGELVDRRQFLSGSQHGNEDVVVEVPEQDIEQIIQMGESESVEFKREIPSKREDIAIAAVSFANHRGGRILVGVADNCEVVGCRLEKPMDTVTQILRSHCVPFPNVVVKEVSVRGLPVVVVTIQEGDDKPYSVDNKGVYVRRGATNRVATRYELDEMYGPKQNPFGL